MKYIVYQTINLVNNKIYIGVHRTLNPDIFDGYYGCGCSLSKHYYVEHPKTPFQYALKKYGFKNFKRSIIKVFDTLEEALKLEEELVDINFIKREDTYNISVGGGYGKTYYPINQFDKTGKLIYTWDNMNIASETLGVSHSSINNAKLHKSSCLGYFWSTEPEINIEEYSYWYGTNTYQYDLTGKIIAQYSSITEAAHSINSKENAISRAINMQIAHKGYYWSFKLVDNFRPSTVSLRGKTLYIYSLDGEYIAELKSMKEAAEFYKVCSPISNIKEAIMLGRPYKNTQISLEKLDKLPQSSYIQKNSPKKIGRYSLEGELLQQYNSIKEAIREYGSGVNRVLSGKQEKTKGFIFRYLD